MARLVHPLGNDLLFAFGGQPKSRCCALSDGSVTAGPGEDEGDGRQEILTPEALNDLRTAGFPHGTALLGLLPLIAITVLTTPTPATVAEPAVHVHPALGAGHGQKVRIDLELGGR